MTILKASVFVLLTIFVAAQARHLEDNLIGHVFRIESIMLPGGYMGEKHFRVHINKEFSDSTWKVVPGLCRRGISIQSETQPGYFIRNGRNLERLEKYQEARQYKEDASFIVHRGLADTAGYSFESAMNGGVFLVNRGHLVGNDRNAGSALFQNEATFLVKGTNEREE